MVIWDEKCFADFTQHNLCDMTIMFRKGDTHVIQPFPIPTLCNINGGQNGEIYRLLKRKESSNFSQHEFLTFTRIRERKLIMTSTVPNI